MGVSLPGEHHARHATGIATPLRAGLVDHLFPNSLGFENEFVEFARGAFAAWGFRSVMSHAFYFRGGVAHSHRKPNPPHDHEVRQIIAEKGHLGFLRTGLAQDIFVGRDFMTLLFVNKLDVQLFAPAPERRAAASGDDAGAQARSHGKRESLAVVRVEGLDFEGMAVLLRRQSYAAIRERPIHIHKQHQNLLRLLRQFLRYPSALCQCSLPFFSVSSAFSVIFALNLFSCVATSIPASTNRASARRQERLSLHPSPL